MKNRFAPGQVETPVKLDGLEMVSRIVVLFVFDVLHLLSFRLALSARSVFRTVRSVHTFPSPEHIFSKHAQQFFWGRLIKSAESLPSHQIQIPWSGWGGAGLDINKPTPCRASWCSPVFLPEPGLAICSTWTWRCASWPSIARLMDIDATLYDALPRVFDATFLARQPAWTLMLRSMILSIGKRPGAQRWHPAKKCGTETETFKGWTAEARLCFHDGPSSKIWYRGFWRLIFFWAGVAAFHLICFFDGVCFICTAQRSFK